MLLKLQLNQSSYFHPIYDDSNLKTTIYRGVGRKKHFNLRGKMKTRIIYLLILFVIWCLATWAMMDAPTKLESLRFIVISLGGYGVISSTLLNIWNALEASKNITDKILFDKNENSFKYFERWDNQSLKEARDLTREIKKAKSAMSDDDLLKKIQGCESTERSVITMFNFWEEIYKSIVTNRVNSEILKEAFSGVYCDMYLRFKVWREDKKKNNDNAQGMNALDELNKLWS